MAYSSNSCSLIWQTGTGNCNLRPEVELNEYSITKTLHTHTHPFSGPFPGTTRMNARPFVHTYAARCARQRATCVSTSAAQRRAVQRRCERHLRLIAAHELKSTELQLTDSSCGRQHWHTRVQNSPSTDRPSFTVPFFSRPRSDGWPHRGRTFSIYLCPLSFGLTLPWTVLSSS